MLDKASITYPVPLHIGKKMSRPGNILRYNKVIEILAFFDPDQDSVYGRKGEPSWQ